MTAASLRAQLREAVDELDALKGWASSEQVDVIRERIDALIARVPEEPVAWVLRTREDPPRYISGQRGVTWTHVLNETAWTSTRQAAIDLALWLEQDAARRRDVAPPTVDLVPVYLGEPEPEGASDG